MLQCGTLPRGKSCSRGGGSEPSFFVGIRVLQKRAWHNSRSRRGGRTSFTMVLGMASLAACLVPQLGLTPLRAVGASTNRIARASAAGSGEGFGYGEGYDPELTAALELVEVSCRAAHHHHHSPHCHHHYHSQHRPFAAASHASHSAPLAAALVGRWAAARPAICSPASSRRRARPPRQTPAARVSASRPSPSPTSPCSACCWALWRSASQMNAAWSELAVLAAAEPATPRLEALSRLRTAALLAAKAEPRPLGPRSAAALGVPLRGAVRVAGSRGVFGPAGP